MSNADTGLVLLFNNCAAPHLAARLHSAACPMVNTAGKGRKVNRTEGADLQDAIDDLEEREYPVKRCKCCKAAA